MLQETHYIKYKTKIDSICKQKITRCSKELLHNRIRNVWSSYKYHYFFSLFNKSRFQCSSRSSSPDVYHENKAEPATTRIKRLLELISSYSFTLYYIKGKDIILSDFLSRRKHDNRNPHGIIPISFNMHSILHDRYYNTGNSEEYLLQT